MEPERVQSELLRLLAYNKRTEEMVDENNRRVGWPWFFFKWRKMDKEIDFRLKYGKARLEELESGSKDDSSHR